MFSNRNGELEIKKCKNIPGQKQTVILYKEMSSTLARIYS